MYQLGTMNPTFRGMINLMFSFGDDEKRRFWTRVEQGPNGCWIWVGGKRGNGYGQFAIKTSEGRWTQTTSHRWAYASCGNEIPSGWEVDHLCKVRSCVRPDHLEAVTVAENRRRRDLGHPLECDRTIRPLPEIPSKPEPPAKRDRTIECRNGHLFAIVGKVRNGANSFTCAKCLSDWQAKRRTGTRHGTESHCPAGHEYSEDNTYVRVRPNGSRSRECRSCIRKRNRERKAQTRH
ncbi:hypothetical protein AUR04nite_00650 [Glutamicibacter uratoxydans]|uniref:HNH nuclease domain-containing protein n=1 Tax=Glutamicibacter uratoxydans TaxID=43667 RepID=A0A4Y4DJ11_GLUUR|nr:hypothetical protein AUR04nite_00650 [Glutamicibacter uratoxydans]